LELEASHYRCPCGYRLGDYTVADACQWKLYSGSANAQANRVTHTYVLQLFADSRENNHHNGNTDTKANGARRVKMADQREALKRQIERLKKSTERLKKSTEKAEKESEADSKGQTQKKD
jgi:hypothetical protein